MKKAICLLVLFICSCGYISKDDFNKFKEEHFGVKQCAEPRFTGENCEECADHFAGDGCTECAQGFDGPNCNQDDWSDKSLANCSDDFGFSGLPAGGDE